MRVILAVTCLSVLLSFIADRRKTWTGVKKGAAMFMKILPTTLVVIIFVSILLFLTPPSFLFKHFGEGSGALGYVFAAAVGAVTLIPGFIAYPVCGHLIQSGVGYPVIAVFVTTLLMVGVVTIPMETKYFGLKITLLRNGLSLVGALFIGLLIGWIW
ncbi:MAG: permease [candidate division KSB1 bacterium]|nr:permease [candidate division KSB1 bacterium]